MHFLHIFFIVFVAIEHLYFLVLEMFFWTKPKGMKTFGLKNKQFAEDSKVLAANQGLYNGFLAAGLLWSLFTKDAHTSVFFFICVAIAGVYGAYSTKKIKLFYLQSAPALLGIAAFLF